MARSLAVMGQIGHPRAFQAVVPKALGLQGVYSRTAMTHTAQGD
jgi:hypothetical protein